MTPRPAAARRPERRRPGQSRRALTAALTVGALALTACGGGSETPTAATDGSRATTLRFLFFGGPEEQEAYQRVVDAFHGEHDDIDVEIQVVAKQDDLLARLTASFAAGTPPDVFLINFRKYGLYAEQGVLAPVQPLLDASDVIDVADFYQAPLDAFRFGGTDLTCLPQNVSSLVTYLNLDLFEAAGIAPPAGDWTWNEFFDIAGDLTSDEPIETRQVYGFGTEPKLIRLAPMIWSAGGEVVDDPENPTRLAVESEAWRAALGFLTHLVRDGSAPGDRATQARDAESRFLDGHLAMFWSSRREVPTFRTITDFDWDVAPFPISPVDHVTGEEPGERVTMLHADAFCLARDGQVDAAWEFVEFALGEVGAPILAESGRTVPSNRTVAQSAAFLRTDVPPASARVFLDNAEIVRATPSTADWNAAEKAADDILEALYYGRIDEEEALRRLAAIRLGTP